jgi:tetrahydromethanopterin S-methyltransferase subunit F
MRVVSLSAFDDKKEQSENGREAVNELEMSSTSQIVRDVPLSRGMIGRDGKVRFRIDVMKVLEGVTTTKDDPNGDDGDVLLVKLKFVHADTGAVMEVRLPPRRDIDNMLGGRDGEIVFGASKRGCTVKDRNDPTRYLLDVMDEDEEESDDEPNEYVEDGFLVYGSHDSDEDEGDSRQSKDSSSGEFSGDDHDDDDDDDDEDEDEDGECQLCLTGGDLIVCDGGNHGGGCGHLYHLHCIGRSVLPPGKHITTPCIDEVNIPRTCIIPTHYQCIPSAQETGFAANAHVK